MADRPTRERDSSRVRRQEILDAALQCFLRSGVAGTTTEEIRAASGASIGSIYHHFDAKAAIAAQLYVDVLGEMHDRLMRGLVQARRVSDGLRKSVASYLRWVMEEPDAVAYLLHCREPDVLDLSQSQAWDLNGRLFVRVLDWLTTCEDPEDMRPLGPQVFFAVWLGPLEMYAQLWLAGSRDPSMMRDAIDELSNALVSAVCQSGHLIHTSAL